MISYSIRADKVVVQSLIIVATLVSGCTIARQNAPGAPSAAMPSVETHQRRAEKADTLYLALGGSSGIEELTSEFIKELAADDRIRFHFKDSDIGRFHRMMNMHICELADGPCEYKGDTMKRTHGGMNIKSSEFNATVEALMRAMDNVKLNPGVQNRLLAILAPMRAEIVGQ